LDKKISRSFIDYLTENNLSSKDIAKYIVKILNSDLSDFLDFYRKDSLIQQKLNFNGEEKKEKKVIEHYIASIILKSIEKGNMDILNILIQESDAMDKDLYRLMNIQLEE
jgi:intergrase/recombinase